MTPVEIRDAVETLLAGFRAEHGADPSAVQLLYWSDLARAVRYAELLADELRAAGLARAHRLPWQSWRP